MNRRVRADRRPLAFTFAPLLFVAAVLVLALSGGAATARAEGWKIGTAKVAITPEKPTWMAGIRSGT